MIKRNGYPSDVVTSLARRKINYQYEFQAKAGVSSLFLAESNARARSYISDVKTRKKSGRAGGLTIRISHDPRDYHGFRLRASATLSVRLTKVIPLDTRLTTLLIQHNHSARSAVFCFFFSLSLAVLCLSFFPTPLPFFSYSFFAQVCIMRDYSRLRTCEAIFSRCARKA